MLITKRFIRLLSFLLFFIIIIRLISLGLYALMDTTEARYAEMSRKILETNNWVTIYYDYNVPFWGKPPLSFWASAVTMKIFGINEFGARLAPFLASLCIGILFFTWLYPRCNYKDSQTNNFKNIYPLASCIVFFSSGLGFIASGAVMTDMFLLLCVMMCMVGFWRCVIQDSSPQDSRFSKQRQSNVKATFWGYVFFIGLGLGLLAKGPLIMILVGFPLFMWIIIYYFLQKWEKAHNTRFYAQDSQNPELLSHTFTLTFKNFHILRGLLLSCLIAVPWYILSEMATPGFLEYFIVGEHINRFLVSGWEGDKYGNAHATPLGMIWLFWIWACLPWSLVFLYMMARLFIQRKSQQKPLKQWNTVQQKISFIVNLFLHKKYECIYLLSWILSPLIFFSFSRNILEAYVLPSLPAFSIFLSILIFGLNNKFSVKIWILPATIIVLFTLFLIYPRLDSVATRHQKDLIELWDKESALLFVQDYPSYSAQFYSQGKFRFYKNRKELATALQKNHEQNTHKTIIMPNSFYKDNSDLFLHYRITQYRNLTIAKNFIKGTK
ncbi:phospholipid carrier-dependent glycosyltransferase [Helicobacter aurati]|uniref:Phospholipid carrier-dependent glycosyltransferase n=1 Tax=Helicobacter aurati TaxID=137778 RepID=A0A3D8J325_9HELI|nr:phospholipid carrier-dependent glycosyltransferase [Helicobacter aurati]RDU71254.1 phospholipid carrier-dependent glycosyltransferase [Helicobacter aurati]